MDHLVVAKKKQATYHVLAAAVLFDEYLSKSASLRMNLSFDF